LADIVLVSIDFIVKLKKSPRKNRSLKISPDCSGILFYGTKWNKKDL